MCAYSFHYLFVSFFLLISMFYSMFTRVSFESFSLFFQLFWISQRRSYARCDMFRLGIITSSPGSLIKLKPHKLKYVWNGSVVEPGHFEKPPVITSCVSIRYLLTRTYKTRSESYVSKFLNTKPNQWKCHTLYCNDNW